MKLAKKSAKSLEETCYDKITQSYGTMIQRLPLLPDRLINEIYKKKTQIDEFCPIFNIDTFVNPKMKDLENISDFHHTGISLDYLFSRVGNVCKILSSLNLNWTNNVSASSVFDLLTNLPNIRSLELQGNHWVNDEFLAAMATRCRRLQRLDISYCNSVTDRGIHSLCRNRNGDMQIEILNFQDYERRMTKITKEGCFHALQHLPKLKRFDTHLDVEFLLKIQTHSESRAFLPTYKLEHVAFRESDADTLSFDVATVFPCLRNLVIFIENDEYENAHLLIDHPIFQNALPTLCELHLDGFDQIDLVHVAACCPVLECLKLAGCNNVTMGVGDGNATFGHLRELGLIWLVDTPIGVYLRLFENTCRLQKLLLDSCDCDSDVITSFVDTNLLLELTHLYLICCEWVTAECLFRLIESDVPLNTLIVESCLILRLEEWNKMREYVLQNNLDLSLAVEDKNV